MIKKVLLLCLTFLSAGLYAEFIVTIIDDDSLTAGSIQTVKGIADEKAIKITFAPIAANLERHPEIAEILRQYQDEGHEIASHSYSHSQAIWKNPVIDTSAVQEDIEKANEILSKENLTPVAFVYPYGNFAGLEAKRRIFAVVNRYFSVAFNSRGDTNVQGKTYPLYISRHALRKHNSFMMVKAMIKKAADNDHWLVILTHSANSDFSADMLRNIIDYAKEQQAVFLPVTKAAEKMAWSDVPVEQLPDYTILHEVGNVAYFHLPLIAVGFVLFCLLLTGIVLKIYRKKHSVTARP